MPNGALLSRPYIGFESIHFGRYWTGCKFSKSTRWVECIIEINSSNPGSIRIGDIKVSACWVGFSSICQIGKNHKEFSFLIHSC